MVNYGVASAILALTAAAVATAQEAANPQPTYWPTYWPTYSPTNVPDENVDRDTSGYESSEKPTDAAPVRPPAAAVGNPNYESSEKPTDPAPERPGLIPPPATTTTTTAATTTTTTAATTTATTTAKTDPTTTATTTAKTDPTTTATTTAKTDPTTTATTTAKTDPTTTATTTAKTDPTTTTTSATEPPPPPKQEWGSSWGEPSKRWGESSAWSNALKGDSEWGGKASKWGKTSKAGKRCNTSKASKAEWSSEWESSEPEWESPEPKWESPEPKWESGSGWRPGSGANTPGVGRPKKPGPGQRPKPGSNLRPKPASGARPGTVPRPSGNVPRPDSNRPGGYDSRPGPDNRPPTDTNPPGPEPNSGFGPGPETNSGFGPQPRCMRAILAPIQGGQDKYPNLGADVLLAYNDVLPEFSPSASMVIMGGNFPPKIVGGYHIHEGTSCENIGSHFFREGWSTLGFAGNGDPWFPDPTPICPTGAVYETDQNGLVTYGTNFANGYGHEETEGKVVVLHDLLIREGGDYLPIACGILSAVACPQPQPDGTPPPRSLYAWPKRTYLNYDGEVATNRAVPPSYKGGPLKGPPHSKTDKEVPLWDDDGWSEPETVEGTWDSWSTAKANAPKYKGTWDSWGVAKAAKWGGSKGGKSSCWDSGDGEDGGSGWGWQPSWPTPPPSWGKPPPPTPPPTPCTNNPSYDCEQFSDPSEMHYCHMIVEGCADGQDFRPDCAGQATPMPGNEVCELYCNPTCFPTSSPTKSPTQSPTSSPTKTPTSSPTKSPTPCTNNPSYNCEVISDSDVTCSDEIEGCADGQDFSPDCAVAATPMPGNEVCELYCNPTCFPTSSPTTSPTKAPTQSPTSSPTQSPTSSPTKVFIIPPPTPRPTPPPTPEPTNPPTPEPTPPPTPEPTNPPTPEPTPLPTPEPTPLPTPEPTTPPTPLPTLPQIQPDPTPLPTPMPTSISTIGSTPTVSKDTTLPPTVDGGARSHTQTYHLGDDFRKDVETECIEETGGVWHQGQFIEVCEFVCRETTILYQNGNEIFRTTGEPTSTDCPQENS
eukprot:scaffold1769_cov132-Skeletonema_dohrnii-CCMP3373.AAC.33